VKILFLDQFSEPGGAQLCLRDVMRECRRRNWSPFFMAPGEGELFDLCESAGIPSFRIPLGPYRSGSKTMSDTVRYAGDTLRAAAAIRRVVREHAIDLVYVNGPRLLPAASLAPAALIFHAHSLPEKSYARRISALAAKRALVIAASQSVAQAFPRARVIYNGVDDIGYVPRPLAGRAMTVGIIGRISPEKGHWHFIRAARVLPEVRFIVFGAALFSNAEYERQIRAEAAGTSVEFRGWTTNIAEALHEIDILAVPSSSVEVTPRVIMEAFSAGTPVVAHPFGGIPELVRHLETGLLTEDLAGGIQTLLGDQELMSRCSRKARQEWSRRFRLERFQTDIANLIAGVRAKQRGHSKTSAAIAGKHNRV
jgi:glycosyltransferase involved in cell wall biosynthesis